MCLFVCMCCASGCELMHERPVVKGGVQAVIKVSIISRDNKHMFNNCL